MGFESPRNANTESINANNDPLSIKVSYGEEIRRVTIERISYAALREKTAVLFGLDQASIVLKYHDDDGDKISMSSDMELQEALRLSKSAQKVMRLFIEAKKPDVPEMRQVPAEEPPVEPVRKYFEPHHIPHHPHHPHPHPHSHQSFGPSQPGFFAPSGPLFGHGSFQPAHGGAPAGPWGHGSFGPGAPGHHGPEHHHPFHHHRFNPRYTVHNASNGVFSAADAGDREQIRNSWREERRTFKENKDAMKQTWKKMKREAVTEEDKAALKQLKTDMKNQMRLAKCEIKDVKAEKWKALKAEKKNEKRIRLVARHVEDVTIPDGTELPPNTPFIKTWKIRNEGPAWPAGSQLLFVSHKGDNLNGPERVTIKGEVQPGQEVEVSVPLITPSEPGRYVGYYRMVTPEGVKFGQRVWVSFVVKRDADVTMSNPPTTTTTTTTAATLDVAKVCDDVDK